MTDNQLGIICGTIAWVAFIAALCFKVWMENKQ